MKSTCTRVASCIPTRYVFGAMSMLGIMMAYIMRACFNVAITQMVLPIKTANRNNDVNICSKSQVFQNVTQKFVEEQFEWNSQKQGIVLSSFYYGYILTHIPGGLLSQRYGGKHTFGLGILCTAIFTLLTPWAADRGWFVVATVRFLEGLGEGTTFPALCTMLAQWAPPQERSLISTAAFTGVQIGTVIANFGSGYILEYSLGGWRNVFYIFGALSVIWFIFWCLLCYDDPSSHPFISDVEREYLRRTIGKIERDKNLDANPWKSILCSTPVWALVVGEIGHDWGLFTMVTDLPKYMNDVMKFPVSQNGVLSSLPYLGTWITSLVFSAVADRMLTKGYISCGVLRKSYATLGAVGPAIGVICASYVGCDKVAASVLFVVGMSFMGFCYSSLRVNALDLSPNYAGTIMALVNGLGSLSGSITPTLTGFLTPNETVQEWRLVFWIMAIVLIGTNSVFVLFGSGEIQSWNDKFRENTPLDLNKMQRTT